MPSKMGNCPLNTPRQRAACGSPIPRAGSGSATSMPGHWLRWNNCTDFQNTFGLPAKWLSRSRDTATGLACSRLLVTKGSKKPAAL